MNDIQFSLEELTRYNRHVILPQFGLETQKKLKAAKVLVVGSGGLGSPILLYLAAVGVGTIGIVDFDRVDESNLQRQVIFDTSQIGMPKAEAAAQRVKSINPFIEVVVHNTKLTSENALQIIGEYDIVADGTDNFPTRYLINDACVLSEKPYVYGTVFQFEGQVSLFNYKNSDGVLGPNYRDLYPMPPPPELIPDCALGGVLGVLPGIIGSVQALELIKAITGIGDSLSGKFLVYDALAFSWRSFAIKADPDNPLTGKDPGIRSLIDYDAFCMVQKNEDIKEISAEQLDHLLSAKENIQLIDVRQPEEYAAFNIGAELIPLNNITGQVEKISRDKKVVVHCHMGSRSKQAIRMLQEKFGFDNLYNLTGGLEEYRKVKGKLKMNNR